MMGTTYSVTEYQFQNIIAISSFAANIPIYTVSAEGNVPRCSLLLADSGGKVNMSLDFRFVEAVSTGSFLADCSGIQLGLPVQVVDIDFD
jgi:hypothetical protein